jgi:dTDP-4-amino-4,6-dideoxygalactose transaminase
MDNVTHAFHLFVAQVEKRDQLMAFLKSKGISSGIHYPIPLPFQKAYSYLGHKPGDFPVAEKLSDSILSSPMYPELTNSQLDYIIAMINEFYGSVE